MEFDKALELPLFLVKSDVLWGAAELNFIC